MVLLNFLLNLTSVFFIISYLKSLCIPLPQAVQSLTLQGITGSLILFLAPDLDQKKKNLEAFAFWKSTDKYLSNGDRNTSCHNECHRARSHGSFLFFFFSPLWSCFNLLFTQSGLQQILIWTLRDILFSIFTASYMYSAVQFASPCKEIFSFFKGIIIPSWFDFFFRISACTVFQNLT